MQETRLDIANIFDQILSTFKFLDESEYSQECGVCGPKGLHNPDGLVCAPGLECSDRPFKNDSGETVSLGPDEFLCVKPGDSIKKCL